MQQLPYVSLATLLILTCTLISCDRTGETQNRELSATPSADEEEWVELFNGRNMDGWDVKNRGHDLDRKSTRLNSSHVAISYAVFCLKKQTKKKTTKKQQP